MAYFLTAFAVIFSFSVQAADFVEITKNAASYTVGQTAQVRMRMTSLPESPGYEFFLKAKFINAPVTVKKVTHTEFYTVLPNLTVGNHNFSVETFLQDKQLAAAFNQAIAHYNSELTRINDLLETETDPQKIADLQAERAFNLSRRVEAETKLESIRRKIAGPETIKILVN